MNDQEESELLIKIVYEFQHNYLVCLVFKIHILHNTKDAAVKIKSDTVNALKIKLHKTKTQKTYGWKMVWSHNEKTKPNLLILLQQANKETKTSITKNTTYVVPWKQELSFLVCFVYFYHSAQCPTQSR